MSMRYITYNDTDKYPICILCKSLQDKPIYDTYIDPYGIEDSTIVYNLHSTDKKFKAADIKDYLAELLPILCELRTEYIVCTDSEYFKILTKCKNAVSMYGYVTSCAIPKFEHINVVYVPNYQSLFYNPSMMEKIVHGMLTLNLHRVGSYVEPGQNIIEYEAYPETVEEISEWLDELVDKDLAIDIETYSLKHWSAGIGTISFAWNQHKGICFRVDLNRDEFEQADIRLLLREFFIRRTAKDIYHNIAFDAYILIYQLFMTDILDTRGMLYGMEVMLKNWECTKLISYLATNSCAGNKLGLKHQAQEFAGNYAVEEIHDITKIPESSLMKYNLVDSLSTWYVYNKNHLIMVQDDQLDIYQNIFQPAIHDIIQMQLTGLPMNMGAVLEGEEELQGDRIRAMTTMTSLPLVKKFVHSLNEKWVEFKNNTLKVKRVTIEDAKEEFNPNSNPQLQSLLYDIMELPVLDYTDSKLPATGGKTLKKLINHTSNPEYQAFLKALIDFKAVDKIVSAFIPAFKEAPQGPDGWHYLFGNFNLGGTVSGRLSSNNPNLQNLPATGSKYKYVIKRMFSAPDGWLFVGLDFSSLEDRISALTTKDPNKLKVYTDGYDGHCLRAFYYFREMMPDIQETVQSVNSIEKHPVYKDYRQKSKAPTFALTYQGTAVTLVNNCGFSLEEAKSIEARYHEMYTVSDEWVQSKLKLASKNGYVTAAFGLRVRTPLLSQTILGNSKTPHEAEAEGRTAGNALGQSWGLLNSRACSEFMRLVRNSQYKYDIRHCAQIHDANYYIIRNDSKLLEWMNEHLVKAVSWQEHPEIAHDEVKLGGDLSVFYPTWADEMVIPNGANESTIIKLAEEHINESE